ncbi:MAG TPA: ABC transporter permease [Acidimicrobiales bacterium]|nr:ABC transporter permease [Acidimicrobiales bacterium]
MTGAAVVASSIVSQVVDWLRATEHWQGAAGIVHRTVQHLQMSFVPLAVAVAVSVPVAVWLGHKRRFGLLAVNVSNVGRALPSFAILAVGVKLVGLREWPIIGSIPVFVAMLVLAIPPIVTNSYVGMVEVPDELRDAARGMGLSESQQLFRAELPIALPLVMAGIRTSAVQVVATATLAAVIGAGGLGRFIIDGRVDPAGKAQLVAGAVLVAVLAVLVEVAFAALQRATTAKGLRSSTRGRPALAPAATPGFDLDDRPVAAEAA